MDTTQRRQFVQKAKADRLAYDAAQHLSLGETTEAAGLAGQCLTIAGREQLDLWLRHYAVTRFKVAPRTVDEFLGGIAPADVAL
jgi:hypothetical protein